MDLKDQIIDTSKELIMYVKNKYDIKKEHDFTCPIMKKLSLLIEQYENQKQC